MAAENWDTNGILTNPVASTILADTGPLTFPTSGDGSGTLSFTAIVSSTVAAIIHIELRNAANDATIKSQAVILAPNATFQSIKNLAVPLNGGERLRLRLNAAVTGFVQGSIVRQ